MRKKLLLALLSLLGLAQSARAQNLGTVSPTTIVQQVFNTVGVATVSPNSSSPSPCTPTAGGSCAIPNLGQVFHILNYTTASSPTFVRIRLEGSWDGVSFFPISDDATDLPSGQVFGIGSYPVVRANLLAITSGSTVTSFYSGASALSGPPLGTYNISQQLRKVIFTNASEGSSATVFNVNTPTLSTAGTLVLISNGASFPAGGSISVSPTYGAATGATVTTQTMGTGPQQTFTIPAAITNQLQVTYNSGGASATTFNAYYFFTAQGQGSIGADPCLSNGMPKSSVAINLTSATTTVLVPLVTGEVVYPCGGSFTIAPSGTSADTILFEFGTGASCGTGTTSLTGAFGAGDLTTTTGVVPVFLGELQPTPVSNALCAVSAGTMVNIQGVLLFVQR